MPCSALRPPLTRDPQSGGGGDWGLRTLSGRQCPGAGHRGLLVEGRRVAAVLRDFCDRERSAPNCHGLVCTLRPSWQTSPAPRRVSSAESTRSAWVGSSPFEPGSERAGFYPPTLRALLYAKYPGSAVTLVCAGPWPALPPSSESPQHPGDWASADPSLRGGGMCRARPPC